MNYQNFGPPPSFGGPPPGFGGPPPPGFGNQQNMPPPGFGGPPPGFGAPPPFGPMGGPPVMPGNRFKKDKELDPWGGGGDPGSNWWEHDSSNEKLLSRKVAKEKTREKKVGFSLAGMLVRDRLAKQGIDSKEIAKTKFRLFDFGKDAQTSLFLEGLQLGNLEVISSANCTFFLLNRLPPNQVILISDLFTPQPKQVFQNLFSFISEGGRVLFLNCSSFLLSILFQGAVKSLPHSNTIEAHLHLTTTEVYDIDDDEMGFLQKSEPPKQFNEFNVPYPNPLTPEDHLSFFFWLSHQ